MKLYLKHLILSSLAFVLMISGCQKKEQEVSFDPATGCSTCAASYANTFVGLFKAGSFTTTAISTSLTINTRVSAYFSNTPVSVTNSTSSINVNEVFFNEDTLNTIGAPLYYTTSKTVNLTSQTWSITGANKIPSFSFKYLHERPSYTSTSVLPDTIRKSVGLTWIVNNLSNITGASFYISDGQATPIVLTKVLKEGIDTVVFTPASLASLANSNVATINFYLENSQAVKIGDKDFKFIKDVGYTKTVSIKN